MQQQYLNIWTREQFDELIGHFIGAEMEARERAGIKISDDEKASLENLAMYCLTAQIAPAGYA